MKITPINSINSIKNVVKNVSKPQVNAKNLPIKAVICASAISGAYIVAKSKSNKKQISDLENIGFNKKTAKTLLNQKDENGKEFINNDNIYMFEHLKNFSKEAFEDINKNPEKISLSMRYLVSDDEWKKRYFLETDKNKIIFTVAGNDLTIDLNNKLAYEYTRQINEKTGLIENFDIFNKETYIETIKQKRGYVLDPIGVLHKFEMSGITDDAGNLTEGTILESNGTRRSFKTIFNNNQNPLRKEFIHLSKDGILNARSKIEFEYNNSDNAKIVITDTDYKNHSIEKNILYKNVNLISDFYEFNYSSLDKTINKVKDPKTGKITTEISEKSDIDKIRNKFIIDEYGNKKTECIAKRNPDGSVNIEKHLKSPEGVKTEYKYFASSDNKKTEFFYQIIDTDGKILTTVDRKFYKISDDRAYSSLNGHEWAISYGENNIKIEDLKTGEIKEEKLDTFIEDENKDFLYDKVKKMPADMLLHILDNKIFIKKNMQDDTSSYFVNSKNTILLRDSVDIIEAAHEMGHGKDYQNSLFPVESNSPFFRMEYEKEKAAFIDKFSGCSKTKIEYLISELGPYCCNNVNSGPKEIFADTNAILSGLLYGSESLLNIRHEIIQKYFPRTIAAAANLLNANYNIFI